MRSRFTRGVGLGTNADLWLRCGISGKRYYGHDAASPFASVLVKASTFWRPSFAFMFFCFFPPFSFFFVCQPNSAAYPDALLTRPPRGFLFPPCLLPCHTLAPQIRRRAQRGQPLHRGRPLVMHGHVLALLALLLSWESRSWNGAEPGQTGQGVTKDGLYRRDKFSSELSGEVSFSSGRVRCSDVLRSWCW